LDEAACCAKCQADPGCKAFSSKKHGLLDEAKCYLHASGELPKEKAGKVK